MSVLSEKSFLGVQVTLRIDTVIGLGIALARVALYLLSCIHVLNEYSRGVTLRLRWVMPTAMPT